MQESGVGWQHRNFLVHNARHPLQKRPRNQHLGFFLTVLVAFIATWFLAASPIRRSVSLNATYDGVVRLPMSFAMISTRSFCLEGWDGHTLGQSAEQISSRDRTEKQHSPDAHARIRGAEIDANRFSFDSHGCLSVFFCERGNARAGD